MVKKDLENNVLYVAQGRDHKDLYSKALVSDHVNFIGERPPQDQFECTARFRYRQPDQKVRVSCQGDKLFIEFAEPQRAVTPGQFAVLYQGEQCLGGSVIQEVIF